MQTTPNRSGSPSGSAAIGSASPSPFITGRRSWALFVGQWPPTLIALALFYKLLRPSMESEDSRMTNAAREMENALR